MEPLKGINTRWEENIYSGGKTIIWSPADFVRLPTDKEMVSL